MTKGVSRQPILALPEALVHKIAAGEVIERPATIVKELLENAVDAQATQIMIHLKDGGISGIRVSDNGIGIPATELSIALQRYTTNKLRQFDDFAQLLSYGFRGEALASIATVSRLTLRSRTSEQPSGMEIVSSFGVEESVEAVGMPTGTDITVEQLFEQIPARKKFLNKPARERSTILDTVTQLSLAVPEVGFTVTDNGEALLNLIQRNTVSERLEDIYGQEKIEQLWPLEHNAESITVAGFMNNPNTTRRSTPLQHLIVNRRVIQPSFITRVVKQAYGTSIDPKTSPGFVLFIDIPPAQIDVNIHPRKEQIQWLHEDGIKQIIHDAITIHLSQGYQATPPSIFSVHDSESHSHLKTLPHLHHNLKSSAPAWYHALARREQTILQVKDTYLITESTEGLLIIDQHAAHERVLYQQFLELFQKKLTDLESISLVSPVLIRLTPTQSNVLNTHLDTFMQVGYQIEPFGEFTYRILSLPALLQDHSPQKVIEHVIEDIENEVPVQGSD
jgi:DNA mismatch repair protein MutL